MALFFTLHKLTIEKPIIRPLKQAEAIHTIIEEGTLINFAFVSHTSAVAINLAFFKVTLKHRSIRVDFKADTIWFLSKRVYHATVQRSRFTNVEFKMCGTRAII